MIEIKTKENSSSGLDAFFHDKVFQIIIIKLNYTCQI